jgi:hypothetical protein
MEQDTTIEGIMKTLLLGLGIAGSLAFTPAVIEPHPHIRASVVELQAAKRELQAAAHDFGGHRVEAIRAIDVALKQLRLAQQFDK